MKEGLCLTTNNSERIQYHSVNKSSVVVYLQPMAMKKSTTYSYQASNQSIKPLHLSFKSLKY